MKLSVDFVGKESTNHMRTILFEMQGSQIGLNGVEKIRKETAVKNLDLSVIEPIRRGGASNEFTTAISEDFAKKSNLFEDKNTVVVRCPRHFFNHFIVETVGVQKCDTTGQIKNAWIAQELDTCEILKAWEFAGFPLEFGFFPTDSELQGSVSKMPEHANDNTKF